MANFPYKHTDEKSLEWVIAIEGLIIGVICGYYISNQGAHSALSFGVGIGAMVLFYFLMAKIDIVFLVWTLGLAIFSSYYIYNSCVSSDISQGWSLIWAAFVGLIVVGIHIKSRSHILAPTFTKITR